MFSGNEADAYKIPDSQYYTKPWEGEDDIFHQLYNNHYQLGIYTQVYDLFGNPSDVSDIIDNLTAEKMDLNREKSLKKILQLSMYRYSPLAFKPFLYLDTAELNKNNFNNEIGPYALDELKFLNNLEKMSVVEDKNFKLIHFNGSHAPYRLNEDMTPAFIETDVLSQTKG